MTDPRLLTVLAISGMLSLGGCAAPAKSPPRIVKAPFEYATVDEQFARAAFFKPRERDGLPFEIVMAPLIVQQVTHGDTLPAADRFGALGPNHSVRVDSPTVYYATSTALLRGRPFKQITFTWFYPIAPPWPLSHVTVLPAGVRMTLDDQGYPLVWEVAWSAGISVYVSHQLNEAAFNEFGPPMSGRKYAIEREAIVARVLDDGPVPMGPFVYLRADSKEVSTLLCRCMPSQVDEFVETTYYNLVPAVQMEAQGFAISEWWPDDPTRIENRLRFPDIEGIE